MTREHPCECDLTDDHGEAAQLRRRLALGEGRGDDLPARLRETEKRLIDATNTYRMTRVERDAARERVAELEGALAQKDALHTAALGVIATVAAENEDLRAALDDRGMSEAQIFSAAYEAGERDGRAAAPAPVEAGPRPTFPILNAGGARIDYQLVADHGGQAKANHYQSVERLAERGGLSWCELHAVLHNRKYQKIDNNEAMVACRELEARYLTALRAQSSPAVRLEALDDQALCEWIEARHTGAVRWADDPAGFHNQIEVAPPVLREIIAAFCAGPDGKGAAPIEAGLVSDLCDAARELLDGMACTYRAGNNRQISIQADDGEKCWIVHSDLTHALECSLAALRAHSAPVGGEGGEG